MTRYFTVSISLPSFRGGGVIFQSRSLRSATDARAEADSLAAGNRATLARDCVSHLQEHIGAAQVIETPYNPYKS